MLKCRWGRIEGKKSLKILSPHACIDLSNRKAELFEGLILKKAILLVLMLLLLLLLLLSVGGRGGVCVCACLCACVCVRACVFVCVRARSCVRV